MGERNVARNVSLIFSRQMTQYRLRHNGNHTKLVKSDRCVQLHSSLTKVIVAKFQFVGDSVGPRHPVAS